MNVVLNWKRAQELSRTSCDLNMPRWWKEIDFVCVKWRSGADAVLEVGMGLDALKALRGTCLEESASALHASRSGFRHQRLKR